jgi:flagellin
LLKAAGKVAEPQPQQGRVPLGIHIVRVDGVCPLATGECFAVAAQRRQRIATQYGDILTQITQLAGDSGYNGTNLLSGNSLTLTLNETGTSSATVAGVTDTSAGLSIVAAASSWAGDTDIAAAATLLTASLTTLQSQSASLSSSLSTIQIRSDFTTAMINTLKTGASALVAADSNEEGANLLALQTQQSLSTTALSLSAQSDRNVLKLFGG